MHSTTTRSCSSSSSSSSSRRLVSSSSRLCGRLGPRPPAALGPAAPDPSQQLVVLAVTAGLAGYWWQLVVPSARRTLAKEKRQGPLRAYLDDLGAAPDRKVERWFYAEWLAKLQRRQQAAARRRSADAAAGGEAAAGAAAAPAAAEQQPGDQQRPIEEDAEPAFFSLDNPLIATAAGIAVVGAVSSVLHGL